MKGITEKPKSFNVSAGREKVDLRFRGIALYFASAIFPRTLGIVGPLVTVPLVLNYLGVERFGLWMTMLSLAGLIGFADLGIGSGLINTLAYAKGKGDVAGAQKSISNAFFMLLVIAAGWGSIFFLIYPWFLWSEIFGVTSFRAIREIKPALTIFVLIFFMNLPLGVVQRAQLGFQEGHIYNLWEGIGRLLSLAGIFVVVFLNLGLPWLVFVFFGVPVLTNLVNNFVFFGFMHPQLKPSYKVVEIKVISGLFSVGMVFLVTQIAYAVGRTSDNIILAQTLGAEAVSIYAIPQQLFSIILVLVMMFSTALWPAYKEAVVNNDLHWVKFTLIKSLAITVALSGILIFVLIIFGKTIIFRWITTDVIVTTDVLIALGIWTGLSALGNVLSMFLFSVDAVKIQAALMSCFAAVAILLKFLLVDDLGITGVVLANITAYIIFFVGPVALAIPQLLRRLQEKRGQ